MELCLRYNTIINRQKKPLRRIFSELPNIKDILIKLTNMKWFLLKY